MNATIPELLYHGKAMSAEPENMPLAAIVDALHHGNPVIAKLEPGDGTHYALLIVPAWLNGVAEHLGRYGIRPTTAASYLIVTQLNDHGGHAFYAFRDGVETWDMQDIENGWTREVFAWWFSILWKELAE